MTSAGKVSTQSGARAAGRRVLIFKIICVVMPFVAALVIGETYLRFIRHRPNYWLIADLLSTSPDKKLNYVFDAQLAYLPNLDGEKYTSDGTLANAYSSQKPPGVRRVLFLGDSVTARGGVIEALAAQYGDADIEYWNAGVEGYDTCQEVHYFERYCHRVQPDHVVLIFHNNDFAPQTVADFDDDGCIALYAADCTMRVRLPWLLRRMEVVRWAATSIHRRQVRASDRVENSLQALATRLAEDNIQFSVVLFPLLQDIETWKPRAVESRERAIAIFKKLNLTYFDVLPALHEALQAGVDPCQTPRDTWHPSEAACSFLAQQLRAEGLLDNAGQQRRSATSTATGASAGSSGGSLRR